MLSYLTCVDSVTVSQTDLVIDIWKVTTLHMIFLVVMIVLTNYVPKQQFVLLLGYGHLNEPLGEYKLMIVKTHLSAKSM